ncbi:hypothetical protein AB6N30_10755 [Fusobacterium animalis]|jgi:hypothetical protein|uniref:Uncharacterized protein n=2 Tax=Fusobacterium TaxID=848 RepID=A0A2C6ANC7_FUSNP|nr:MULTISPECIES: hypothetical protein [Fusobacterium]AGM24577.1 hypothetical protein HMPREF0409_03006 [Fusobacterium animalis 4_8]ALM95434.1 hypothetical protein RO02_12570 [Fusobacterium polymorphum]ERT39889.1 hypothetical protein HMPREF1538_02246 [Fusobacterium nucleatum CTI-1]PHI03629.1 hypothetical protein CBG52_12625 [Fusobacterium polymorphum]QNE67350.1 hypothetical protein H5V36_11220 [Fusobacterium hwasookii]
MATLTYNENDIVILTKKEYNKMMKEIRNYRYLKKIESRMEDIKNGKGILKPVPTEVEDE